MQKKRLLSLLFLFTWTFSFAQSGNTKISTQRIQTKYHNNSEYKVKHFYDNYRLVLQNNKESNGSVPCGILKDTSLIIPIKFGYNYYVNKNIDNKFIILSLGKFSGLFDFEKDKWTVPFVYQRLSFVNKKSQLFLAQKENLKGIIDNNNQEILEIKWHNIENINSIKDFVFVSKKIDKKKIFKGLYDVNALKMVLKPEYAAIKHIYQTDYFLVTRQDGLRNIFDKKGNFLFNDWYKKLDVITGNPIYFIVKDGENIGIINKMGEEIVPFAYSEINPQSYNDGSYLAKNKSDKYGFITKEGEIILPFIYDKIENLRTTALSYKDNKCGIIQINNGIPYEIATCDYESIITTKKAFIVKKEGKLGLMDFYGGEITEVIYDEFTPLTNDFFIAKNKVNCFLFNANGEQLTTESYLEISPLNDANSSYKNSFFYLKVKNKEQQVGLIDKLGVVMVEPIFSDITFEQWNVLVVKKEGKFGLYSIKEKAMIAPYIYDQIVFATDGFYAFQGNTIYVISETGEKRKIN